MKTDLSNLELTEIRNSVRKILYEVLGKHGLPDDIQYNERIDNQFGGFYK